MTTVQTDHNVLADIDRTAIQILQLRVRQNDFRLERSFVAGCAVFAAHNNLALTRLSCLAIAFVSVSRPELSLSELPLLTGSRNSYCYTMRVRVLLADDFPAFTDLIEALLEPAFEVVGKVSDGESLVRAALELQPDVIITDISMPILSGIEAVRKLREVGSRTEVVFLTIHSGADFVRICLAAGALGYVVKSRLDRDLLPALSEMLGGRTFISDTAGRTN